MSGNRFPWLTALFAASLFWSFSASAQVSVIEEAEPNNPCMDAQFVDSVPLPFSISGRLDSTETEPDVDFFRIFGAAGQYVTFTLEGAATSMGTLRDPFLGYFDTTCRLIAVSDDYGSGSNSRLSIRLTESGEYVLGATQCCDYEFLGGGTGSYVLNVFESDLIEQISGRVVDADTLEPLAGDGWVNVVLHACSDEWCGRYDGVKNQRPASDGTFLFKSDYSGDPLEAGTYLLSISASGYESHTEIFELNEGEPLDLGDLLLTRIETIGSVSGRLVDAREGWPLPGNAPTSAFVVLEKWANSVWNPQLSWETYSDEQGMFFIDGTGWRVRPGVFRVLAVAQNYYPLATEAFDLGIQESIDLGDLALMPLPIEFGEVSGCEVLPLGDVCDFSVKIHNRGIGGYRGAAWSMVRYSMYRAPLNPYSITTNRFQIGRRGAHNPRPVRVNLVEDEWTTLEFRLVIPEWVPKNTSVCVTATVGRYPYPQFDNVGERGLFCAETQPDGSLSRLSSEESRHLLRELNPLRD